MEETKELKRTATHPPGRLETESLRNGWGGGSWRTCLQDGGGPLSKKAATTQRKQREKTQGDRRATSHSPPRSVGAGLSGRGMAAALAGEGGKSIELECCPRERKPRFSSGLSKESTEDGLTAAE